MSSQVQGALKGNRCLWGSSPGLSWFNLRCRRNVRRLMPSLTPRGRSSERTQELLLSNHPLRCMDAVTRTVFTWQRPLVTRIPSRSQTR